MAEVIPAVLPKNYEDLKGKIAAVKNTVGLVQVDICDGKFVPSLTWPFLSTSQNEEFEERNLDANFKRILNEEEGMPFWEDVDFELDLMVKDAVDNFDVYTKLGPKRIIFHIESVEDVEEFRNFLEGIDNYIRDVMEIGVAINPNTPVENIFPLISLIDVVQVMGIDHEGMQGEEFNPQCLEHIKKLKENFPDVVVSVDGGVNFETATEILNAGANRLIVGSAIFNAGDIIGSIERFKEL